MTPTDSELRDELMEHLHEAYRGAVLLMVKQGRSPGVIAANLIHTFAKGKLMREALSPLHPSPSESFSQNFMCLLAAAYYHPEWMAAWVGALNTEMADELRAIADDLVIQLPFLSEMSEAAS